MMKCSKWWCFFGFNFQGKYLIMELKNANPSGYNAVINDLHPMILFFSKNIKNLVK